MDLLKIVEPKRNELELRVMIDQSLELMKDDMDPLKRDELNVT